MPRLPDPDFSKWGHGTSLLGGWLPISIEILTIVILIVAVGWRTRRWRLVWVPVSAAIGVIAALAVRTYMNSEGLASDPAPFKLWVWTAVCAGSPWRRWDFGTLAGGDVDCPCLQFPSPWCVPSSCSTSGWATIQRSRKLGEI
jgi:hypothetical protein